MNSTVLALECLYHEIAFVTRHSVDEGREHLNNLEIEHLIKMTNDITKTKTVLPLDPQMKTLLKMTNDFLMKIKQQTKEMPE